MYCIFNALNLTLYIVLQGLTMSLYQRPQILSSLGSYHCFLACLFILEFLNDSDDAEANISKYEIATVPVSRKTQLFILIIHQCDCSIDSLNFASG